MPDTGSHRKPKWAKFELVFLEVIIWKVDEIKQSYLIFFFLIYLSNFGFVKIFILKKEEVFKRIHTTLNFLDKLFLLSECKEINYKNLFNCNRYLHFKQYHSAGCNIVKNCE